MEAAVERDDGAFAGGAAGHFQGVFRRFRAAVGEHAGQWVADWHKLAQLLHQGQVRAVRGRVEGVVGQAGGLSLDGLDYSGVAVAQVEHADTADEVDVTFAVSVPDFGITAMGKCDRVNDGNGLADTFLVHGGTRTLFEFLIIQACRRVIPQTNYSIAIIPWIRDLAGFLGWLPASSRASPLLPEARAGQINRLQPPAPGSTARRP
ncbi:hypothetical protein D9M71_204470 [compost metagenome]